MGVGAQKLATISVWRGKKTDGYVQATASNKKTQAFEAVQMGSQQWQRQDTSYRSGFDKKPTKGYSLPPPCPLLQNQHSMPRHILHHVRHTLHNFLSISFLSIDAAASRTSQNGRELSILAVELV